MPSISTPQINIPIPTPPDSQPVSLVTVSEVSTLIGDHISDFGDDAVVSLGENFQSRKEKVVVKKGTKRSREGTLVHGTIPNQVIWKMASIVFKQKALETTTTMGAFGGANKDSVSSLNKEIEMKKRNCRSSNRSNLRQMHIIKMRCRI